jgi:hypothetical protein
MIRHRAVHIYLLGRICSYTCESIADRVTRETEVHVTLNSLVAYNMSKPGVRTRDEFNIILHRARVEMRWTVRSILAAN